MAITDLTNTTWVFNNSIDFTQSETTVDYSIDFYFYYQGSIFSYDKFKYIIIHNYDLDNDYWKLIIRYENTEDSSINVEPYIHTVGSLSRDEWHLPDFKTITITGGSDVTNATLIAWLEANATQQTATAGVEVTYNNNTIKTQTENGSFTLSCNGKKMASDVVISATDVQAITATYNGNTIINGSGTHTYTLSCNGKKMSSDVVVNVITQPVMPVKGDLVNIDMTGSGTPQQFRILKNVNNLVYEVFAMELSKTNIKYGTSNSYSGSNVDTALNTTYYGTLSNTAKSAIVDKNIVQYQYDISSATSNHKSQANYSTKATKQSVGNRHIYALDVEDIETYFNGVFTNSDLYTLFCNQSSKPSTLHYRYLRSAVSNGNVFVFDEPNGQIGNITPSYSYVSNSWGAFPTFQIDLSKIDFTIVT